MNPLVSMIIPAYNAEKTIERCIHSVINQTYQNIEVIVVDDGSIDNTFLLCEKYMGLSNFIYHKQENQGVSSARNKGIELSNGEYIAFVDSDDYVKTNMLELYLKNASKDVDLFCSLKNKKFKESYIYKNIQETKKDFKDLLNAGFFTSPHKMYKKDKIKKHFEKEISYGEDLLFNLEFFKDCQGVYCNYDGLYVYNLDSDGLTKKLHNNEFETILKLSNNFLIFFNDTTQKDLQSDLDLYNFLANYFVVFFQKYCFKHKLWDLRLKPYLKNKEYQFILKNSTNSSLNMKILKTNSAFLIASFFKCKQLVKFVLARGKNV